ESDCRLLWEWANSAEVRLASFSSDEIPFADHLRWYETKIASPDCLLYIASNEQGIPVGHVRFDVERQEAIISVVVAKDFRGKGMGSKIIKAAARDFLRNTDATLIHAYIKSHNGASLRAFSRAGFHPAKQTEIRGHRAAHMTMHKTVAD